MVPVCRSVYFFCKTKHLNWFCEMIFWFEKLLLLNKFIKILNTINANAVFFLIDWKYIPGCSAVNINSATVSIRSVIFLSKAQLQATVNAFFYCYPGLSLFPQIIESYVPVLGWTW